MSEFEFNKTNVRSMVKKVDTQRNLSGETSGIAETFPGYAGCEAVQATERELNQKVAFWKAKGAEISAKETVRDATLKRVATFQQACVLAAQEHGPTEAGSVLVTGVGEARASIQNIADRIKVVPHYGHAMSQHLLELREEYLEIAKGLVKLNSEFVTAGRALAATLIQGGSVVSATRLELKSMGVVFKKKKTRKALKAPLDVVGSPAAALVAAPTPHRCRFHRGCVTFAAVEFCTCSAATQTPTSFPRSGRRC